MHAFAWLDGERAMAGLLQGTFRLAAIGLALGLAAQADATTFMDNDFVTYTQSEWGDGAGTGGTLLADKYGTVYSALGGAIEIGVPGAFGNSITFTTAAAVDDFLPTGTAGGGALAGDLVDPTVSPAGRFAGNLLALKLNIDFGDTGFLASSGGVAFGDLVIGPDASGLPPATSTTLIPSSFYGFTLRQFNALANQALGGTSGYSADFDQTTFLLTGSFENGAPSETAQRYLSYPNATAVPEPASWAMLITGFGAIGVALRRRSAGRLMVAV